MAQIRAFRGAHSAKSSKRSQAKSSSLSALGVLVPMPQSSRSRRTNSNATPKKMVRDESGLLEQEWIRANWQAHVGQWVALDGGQLIAEAAGAREALESKNGRR